MCQVLFGALRTHQWKSLTFLGEWGKRDINQQINMYEPVGVSAMKKSKVKAG